METATVAALAPASALTWGGAPGTVTFRRLMSGSVRSPPSHHIRSEKSIGERARDAVMELIVRHELKAGDKLPSEAELSQMFNISRPTLREALKLLEQDGLIFTTHGRGRFISAAAALRVERPITAYESITSMLRQLGYKPQTRIVSVEEQPADKEAARALRCRVGHRQSLLSRQHPIVSKGQSHTVGASRNVGFLYGIAGLCHHPALGRKPARGGG